MVVVLFGLGACQTTAEVAIDLDETGTGRVAVQVELDDAAAERVGDLDGLLAVGDLREGGWRVSTTERRVLAEKKVRSAAEVDRALDELGPPFAGLSFGRRRTFARTASEVSGRVDLAQGMAAFGDEDLRRATGSVTGVDLPPEALALYLTVDLPGDEETNAPGPDSRWNLPLGVVTAVRAESTDVNVLGLSAVGMSVLSGLVLVFALVRRLRP